MVLAETLGSVAGYLCSEGEQKVVGLEVNANHIRFGARGPGARRLQSAARRGRAIRSGKLKSSTNSRGYVVHHD